MLRPQSDQPHLEPNDVTALGPAIIFEVREAVEAVVASPDAESARLQEAIGVLVERTRAFHWPPEKSATVLTQIFRNARVSHGDDLPLVPALDDDHALAVYQRALAMCLEAHQRNRPQL